MSILFILLTSILLSTNSIAGGIAAAYGVGVYTGEQASSLVDVKIFSILYQEPAFWYLDRKYEFGVWADTRSDLGRKSSGYIAYSYGVESRPGWFYLNSFWGIAAITSPDTRLGSSLNFMQDFGIGVEDKKGKRFGFSYKHISNAGIVQPNKGRDFIQLKIQVPW